MAPAAADVRPRRRRARAAAAGVAAAAAALGIAEVIAALAPVLRSPVLAVGEVVIRLAPSDVTTLAIELFGTADKPALLIGIVAVLALYASAVGVVGLRSRAAAAVGAAVLAIVGAAAAISEEASPTAALPSVVAGVVAIGVLLWLLARLSARGGRGQPAAGDEPAPGASRRPAAGDDPARHEPGQPAAGDEPAPGASRRGFLRLAGGVTAGGVVLAIGGRMLSNALGVNATSESVTLPAPARRVALPIPDAAHPDVEGLPPFVTPNDSFYRIDTALTVPRVDPATHRVAVTGMVDRELDLALGELLERDLVDIPITLSCVSNEIGGDLVDTAVWRGIRLRQLLDEAGVDPGATQVVGRSVDDYTCGFPVEAAYDRDALVAVGMNGEALPVQHGFPVRLVVPGLYGYVSATKWLSQIELTTFEDFDQYWVPRGYAEQAPVKTASAIRVPQPLAQLAPGPQAIAGVAWAPSRGIQQVEVRVDDGPWEPATLGEVPNDLTWRQWRYRWEATPGRHRLRVRATDATGRVQPEQRVDPKPDGATGWHTIVVVVSDA